MNSISSFSMQKGSNSLLPHSCIQGRRENPLVGEGVGLNLREFTWLLSCSIVTNHYLFQRFIALFFGYLQEVGTGG